jgi:hypothetical protein
VREIWEMQMVVMMERIRFPPGNRGIIQRIGPAFGRILKGIRGWGGGRVCGDEHVRNTARWLGNLSSLFDGSVFALVDHCDNRGDDGNDDDDENDDEQAPPLLAVAAPRLFDSATNLCVCLDDVLVDLLAFLLNVGNKGLLLLHNLVEVLEELGELDHLALNVLDSLVALLDVAEGR